MGNETVSHSDRQLFPGTPKWNFNPIHSNKVYAAGEKSRVNYTDIFKRLWGDTTPTYLLSLLWSDGYGGCWRKLNSLPNRWHLKTSHVPFCQLKARFRFLRNGHGRSDNPFVFTMGCSLEYCFDMIIPLFLGKQRGAAFSEGKKQQPGNLVEKTSTINRIILAHCFTPFTAFC